MLSVKFPRFTRIISDYKGDRLYIEYNDITKNIIKIGNTDYFFENLTPDGNKGGNSIILKLFEVASIENQNSFEELEPCKILKFLKRDFEIGFNNIHRYYTGHKRLINEIDALKKCKSNNSSNVVNIFENGYCIIQNKNFLFYTMEVAKCDLKDFIELNHNNLTFEEKVSFCIEILDAINQLDNRIFFHRDIKPDNIFLIDNKWKIGDLGLVGGEDLIYNFDENGKFIGPRGWVSPEVMNKYLSENKGFKYLYDCKIDHQSDIFQLGKLFWYIFQHNAPIGYFNYFDFNNDFERVYWIIRKMLQHSKVRRFNNVEDIIPLFQRINTQLLTT